MDVLVLELDGVPVAGVEHAESRKMIEREVTSKVCLRMRLLSRACNKMI